MDVKFLLLRGLPASGKSTYAQKLVDKGWKRLNKDMMRDMIDGGQFSSENEFMLNSILYQIAEMYLSQGYNVVSDNMNFNSWHFKQACDLSSCICCVDVKVEVFDFYTDIEVCIERDKKRTKPVTEAVIRKIAKQWNLSEKFPDITEYAQIHSEI